MSDTAVPSPLSLSLGAPCTEAPRLPSALCAEVSAVLQLTNPGLHGISLADFMSLVCSSLGVIYLINFFPYLS